MSIYQKLKDLVAATEAEAKAFHEKGNKAAGTRLRKAYQEITVLARQGRAEVMDMKNKGAKK